MNVFVMMLQTMLLTLSALTYELASAQVQSEYKLMDSRIAAEDFHPTIWLDNDRVLFTAVKLGTYLCDAKDVFHCGGRGHLLATSIWDVRKNVVSIYKDRILSGVCVQNGYISYKAREHLSEQEGSVFAGEFGKEQKIGSISEYRYNNPLSCRYYKEPRLPGAAKGRRIAFLLEEHGYVDFGPDIPANRTPEEKAAPPVLRSLNGKKAIPLNIERRYLENSWMRFTYVRFSNEYFSRADTIDHSALVPAFYLNPEGNVRKVEFGLRRHLGGTYHAVKPGIFLNTDGDTLDGRHGGGYLLSSAKLAQIISGGLRSVSVSPDGCKVAFVYARSKNAISQGYQDWREGKPGNTLGMIDLCHGTKR
jgi:hypothetical protein